MSGLHLHLFPAFHSFSSPAPLTENSPSFPRTLTSLAVPFCEIAIWVIVGVAACKARNHSAVTFPD